MKKIVIIGAGDFGREVANVIFRINEVSTEVVWNIIGFIDDDPNIQDMIIDGYPVIGTMDFLNRYPEDIYVVCSLGTSKARKKVLSKIQNPHVQYATIIDPDARIYKDVEVGVGSIICGGTILAINSKVGNHVIINLNCTVGHDDIIKDYCVVNPGVNISGRVIVHTCSDLGTGTKIIQGLEVGPNTTIGAGAVVVKSIPSDSVAVGCPAKVIKKY